MQRDRARRRCRILQAGMVGRHGVTRQRVATTPGPGPYFAVAMISRILSVLFVLLISLLALGRLTRARIEPPPRPAPDAPLQATPTPTSPPQEALDSGASKTPTIDLLARLEGRRRLARAARSTYFDSLFAETDSVVRRWPEGNRAPFLVAIPPGDSAQYDAQLLATVSRAVAVWEDAGLGFRFVLTVDTANVRIVVRGAAHLDGERAGQTDLQWTRDGAIRAAQISLARADTRGRQIPEPGRLAVAVHEFGHALGLSHSPNSEDLMFPATQTSKLSRRDRNTVTLLYELPLGTIRENPPQ